MGLYTAYNEEEDDDNTTTTTKSSEDVSASNRNMRPIKISNRELLDEDSYFTILKKDLRENDQFVLLPKSAWEQLHEWYGGGPSIERFVVCTDKKIRMKVINFSIKKLEFEYAEQQRLQKEAKKKKKSPKKRVKSDEESEHSSDDGSFDAVKYEKEFKAFLQELSMMTHPETLRIDLHPIYCNFLPIDEKNKIADEWSEFSISRYATMPELYINICVRCGYSITDIDKETDNYKLYLQQLIDLKSQERNKNLEKK